MNLNEKLLDMQKRVTSILKDDKNMSDKYDFVSGENALNTFRPMMDELKLLLVPRVERAELHEGATKSGTSRFMTEVWYSMVWLDVESGETLSVPWYAQGVDLAGEKGVGKAATYGEKYFLLKFFHVPTKKDDPDSRARREATARYCGCKGKRGVPAQGDSADAAGHLPAGQRENQGGIYLFHKVRCQRVRRCGQPGRNFGCGAPGCIWKTEKAV